MSKALWVLVGILAASGAQAEVTCKDLQAESVEMEELREGSYLNRATWKKIDVISGFDYGQCKDGVTQTLVRVNGEYLWKFASTEDSCDGGNTYGSIYSYDLKTPIAHIYDGDIVCEDKWSEGYRAENHKCDISAELMASRKMREFGLDFTATGSLLKLRRPYAYDAMITVLGTVMHKGLPRDANLQVLTRLEDCKIEAVTITHLNL